MSAIGFNVIQRAFLNRHRDRRMHGAIPKHNSERLIFVGRGRRRLILVDLGPGRFSRYGRHQHVQRRLRQHHHARRGRVAVVTITVIPKEPGKRARKKAVRRGGMPGWILRAKSALRKSAICSNQNDRDQNLRFHQMPLLHHTPVLIACGVTRVTEPRP